MNNSESFYSAQGVYFPEPVPAELFSKIPNCEKIYDVTENKIYLKYEFTEFSLDCTNVLLDSLNSVKSIFIKDIFFDVSPFQSEDLLRLVYFALKDTNYKFGLILDNNYDKNEYTYQSIKEFLRIEPELSTAKEYLKEETKNLK